MSVAWRHLRLYEPSRATTLGWHAMQSQPRAQSFYEEHYGSQRLYTTVKAIPDLALNLSVCRISVMVVFSKQNTNTY